MIGSIPLVIDRFGVLFLKFSPSFERSSRVDPVEEAQVQEQLVVSGGEVTGEEAVELRVLENDGNASSGWVGSRWSGGTRCYASGTPETRAACGGPPCGRR